MMESGVTFRADEDLLITNARIIDGTGSPPGRLKSIHVTKGEIAGIGQGLMIEDARVLDVAGATLTPGIIDAHVHLQSVPGSILRQDSDQALEQSRHHHLRAYLACGVTTVLDNAISASMLREFQDYLASGGVGPRICALAPAFYPPGGYLDNGMLTPYWGPHWRPAGSAEDVRALFDEYQGLDNIVGLKVMLEPGFGASAIWPLLSPKIRDLIVEESAKRNLPIYAHAYKKNEQSIALDMGVRNLAHSGFLEGSPSDDFLKRMKENGAYLTTTIASTMDQLLVNFHPERLDDELLRLTVPAEQLATAADPEAWKKFFLVFLKNSAPKWLPEFMLKAIIRFGNLEKQIQARIMNAGKAIMRMHQAGIPIVLGTDTSNWPLFISFFHGPSTIREIELLGEAGMSPMEVICSATRIPAEMMGMSGDFGTVQVGKRADLVVLTEDPLQDLSAFRRLAWVIKDGWARTPAQWLA
jgi:imidazolonepropionase-like amidohydrolase